MNFLLVALGGAIGSAARYGVSLAAARWLTHAVFPWATLTVNIIGSFAIGTLAARTQPHETARLLIGVGILGGFTTFSAFSLETVRLLEQQPAQAMLYVAASLLLSVGACWLGLSLGRV